jgi:tryptophan synthase alpha chain
MLDDRGVGCLELAVPFPDSVTDGPVIRRSAGRALASGIGLDEVLDFVTDIHAELHTLRIAVFADWSYTVRPLGIDRFVSMLAGSGAHGVLLHGVPPRCRGSFYERAGTVGVPVVTTCYAGSPRDTLVDAASNASAYVYLVAHYGRSGTVAAPVEADLRPPMATLRSTADVPVAVGFGVRTRADVERVHALGADAAIVGSAVVACVESSMAAGGDVVAPLTELVTDLCQPLPRTGVAP